MPAPDYAVEIANLEAAASSGELTVEENGTRVTYRSMSDLMTSLTYFRGQAVLSSVATGAAPSNVTVAAFDRD